MQTNHVNLVSVLPVGIGGYGYFYLDTLLHGFPDGFIIIPGIVDPFASQSGHYKEIVSRGIPVFNRLEDFYDKGYSADLVVISSPLHFHVHQSAIALKNSSNVLCDKPIGIVVQEVEGLIRIKETSGKWLRVGYQWSYSKAVQTFKQDILKGIFGAPLRLKTLCFWPRNEAYYKRNNWAGKIKDSSGRWILDSPASNAMAHFLHNLLYVLGEELHSSVKPKDITAELYKAYPIENYDSVACRIYTKNNIELLFYASHSTFSEKGPMFHFEFENAIVRYGETTKEIIATGKKGKKWSYGSPETDSQFLKLFEAVEAVRKPIPVVCGPEAAIAQTISINGIQDSVEKIIRFPEQMINREVKENRLWVKELDKVFFNCYLKGILPHEANLPWAKSGKNIDLRNYNYFPGGKLTDTKGHSFTN